MKRTLPLILATMACAQAQPEPQMPQSPEALAAPQVRSPAPDEEVRSPLMVAGSGLQGALIQATLRAQGQTLAQAEATVDLQARYSLSLSYEDAPPQMELSVVQRLGDRVSEPVVIPLSQARPDAPVVRTPRQDASVASPLWVQGDGEPGASLQVRLLEGAVELGVQAGKVTPQGSFAVSVAYPAPAVGAGLTLEVTQSVGEVQSERALVHVVHRPRVISGNVVQLSGHAEGTQVFVRLYAFAEGEPMDPTIRAPVQSLTMETQPGEYPQLPFYFEVPQGRYGLYAFRDAAGPQGPLDQRPTLPVDPQAPLSLAIEVGDADSEGHRIELVDPAGVMPAIGQLSVQTMHTSFEPRRPYRYEPLTDAWVEGQGLCEGFYLSIRAYSDGPSAAAPKVQLPDGRSVTLLDDGGCGDTADNTAMSFDDQALDGAYAYGLPDPGPELAGDYVLVYLSPQGFLHEEVDQLAQIKKLDRAVDLLSPAGPGATDAEIRWSEVPGATQYRAHLSAYQAGYHQQSAPLLQARYLPPSMPDDQPFHLEIEAYDLDPNSGDVDAFARSVPLYFFTDSGRDTYITVRGDLVRDVSVQGDYLLRVRDEHSGEVLGSARLEESATEFALPMLPADRGFLEAAIDELGSKDPDAEHRYRAFQTFAAREDARVDLEFRTPVMLASPLEGAQTSATPNMVWEDYSAHAPQGAWSYGLYLVDSRANGFPSVVYGLPPSVTSFDFADPPEERYDLIYLLTCGDSGGRYEEGVCLGGMPQQGALSLSSDERWQWGVVIIPCDLEAYLSSVDLDGNKMDDYTDCLLDVLQNNGIVAESEERSLTVTP